MTENERGRCLTIPVSMVGLVAMWTASVVLLGWDTAGGPDVLGKWGLLCSAGAAAWTVIYGLARQHVLLRGAFNLGKAASVAEMRRR